MSREKDLEGYAGAIIFMALSEIFSKKSVSVLQDSESFTELSKVEKEKVQDIIVSACAGLGLKFSKMAISIKDDKCKDI